VAIQGHRVKTALLPLLTQHTQLGHSHRQHPEPATAAGETPAREQNPRAWGGRAAHGMLPNPAMLEPSPKQELTPLYRAASLQRCFCVQRKSQRNWDLALCPCGTHPSEVESGVNLKFCSHEKGLLMCPVFGDPTRFATRPSRLPREQVLSPKGPDAVVLHQTPSFLYPVHTLRSPGSCLKSAHSSCDEEQQVSAQGMILPLQ